MKPHVQDLTPQYVTNESGQRVSVILPIKQYETLLEDLDDLAKVAERQAEPSISHDELLADLKKDGLL